MTYITKQILTQSIFPNPTKLFCYINQTKLFSCLNVTKLPPRVKCLRQQTLHDMLFPACWKRIDTTDKAEQSILTY